MNITGNAGSWILTEIKEKKIESVSNTSKKSLNISMEIKQLKEICEKLDVKYKEKSEKDVHDALIDIFSAIKALSNIKN